MKQIRTVVVFDAADLDAEDLHVEDPKQAHEQAMSLGARLLRAGDL